MREVPVLVRVVALMAVLFVPTLARAVPVLDIDMTPTPGFAINVGTSTRIWEQTYVSGADGLLTGIEFFYERVAVDSSPTGNGATPADVRLFVGLGSAFQPIDQLSAFQLTLPVAPTATAFFVDVSSANIRLTQGLAFTVGWQGTGAPFDAYPRVLGTPVPLAAGVRDFNTLNEALGQSALSPAIRTYVDAATPVDVPEPSTLALFAGACLVIALRMRRRGPVLRRV